jgi:aminoglycoside/choline kinase family phosphotransferase
MSDRSADIAAVLQGSPWEDWRPRAITGDASARRYLRLMSGEESVIMMDAPPDICTDTARFVEIAQLLAQGGFAAPNVLKSDLARGVLILSDLGATDFAAHLRTHPDEETAIYTAATDLLIAVRDIAPPSHLVRLTPDIGAEMIDVLSPAYVDADISALQFVLKDALDRYAPTPDTLALRDFHAENLIWRPDRTGHARVGLLDFQDAFVAPAGYDLASLLRDARRDVSPATSEKMISRYAVDTDLGKLRLQIATLGVQRNLRILGIFARLAQAGKPRYLHFMDRVWSHIRTDLAAPELADLRAAVKATLPAPTPTYLVGLHP